MRGHFNFQVRTNVFNPDIVVLDQQDQPYFGVLEPVLIAGITTNTTLRPLVSSELDDVILLIEQRHDFGTDQAVVQLANGIHATAQQTHIRQISKNNSPRINKQSPFGRLKKLAVRFEHRTNLMDRFTFHRLFQIYPVIST
ncbi:hypothetical protein D9M69_474950 [compost metagenome]